MKSKPPGTFIVRDSNSFPGAFGLAVKVATPPPNVKASSSGGDPANELVRHFLIEPTARGVRLKGCTNEPVFGEPRRGSTDLDDLNGRIFELTCQNLWKNVLDNNQQAFRLYSELAVDPTVLLFEVAIMAHWS